MRKFFKIIYNSFFAIMIVCFLFILFINIINKDDIPTIGKYSLLSVKGDSMYPIIKNGDLIIINREKKDHYEINDIISFINDKQVIVTHQIIDNTYEDKYLTKGVNNVNADGDYVLASEIIGKYENISIPFIGFIISFANTMIGYIILVVVPIGVMLFIAIYELLKELSKKREEL